MKGLIAVYASLVIKGKKTIDEVPKNLKTQVKKAVEEMK